MTLDRALSGNPFDIDQFRCRFAADRLRGLRLEVKAENWSHLPATSQLVFKTLFVSICQQFNWDFLQEAMSAWLLPDPERKLVEVAGVRPAKLRNLLAGYYKPERIQAVTRARMLRTTAVELQALIDSGRISQLVENPRLEGVGGFYEVMRGISAFAEDTLEKKLRVLAHDLYREGVLIFSDPQFLRPAIEYHIIRLYIRTGRVYPTDQFVREQLSKRGVSSRTRLVMLLRKMVEEALELTAFYANLDIAVVNQVEWHLGRSVCTPITPNCIGSASQELPKELAALSPNCCPYSEFCRSFTESSYGWYHEPQFQKAIY